jgi:hypothetical protein
MSHNQQPQPRYIREDDNMLKDIYRWHDDAKKTGATSITIPLRALELICDRVSTTQRLLDEATTVLQIVTLKGNSNKAAEVKPSEN